MQKLRLQFRNDQLAQRLNEGLHRDVLSYIAAYRFDHGGFVKSDRLAEGLCFEKLSDLRS